ncbi:putative alanine-tRNA ligase/alanyl-tRNA synthetase protein [Blattamonas nauphoetae]|uniref:Alanine-tRNA ligase/alanyl-tRNA synthetase protein n=1 Tax=Blattamonas nauphoetae TaxID=2049346 RepID=A0ABQ9X200_9EUKA|nr:putative alanine-tRNA ligase/alanyl-tRNA synthetase protein [Blattamonas nauphoetae]
MPKRERPSTAERALQLANERNQRNLQIENRLLVQHQRELRDTPPLLQKLKQDHPTDRELAQEKLKPDEHKLTYQEAWNGFKQSDTQTVPPHTAIHRCHVITRWCDDVDDAAAEICCFQPIWVPGELKPHPNPLIRPQFCIRFHDHDSIGL